MKILKLIGIILLVLILAAGIITWIAPTKYELERTSEIAAPRNIVFDQVRFFSKYREWIPWNELDTAMITKISGEDGTVGAEYSWSGNDKVGTGSQTITAITEDRIEYNLRFFEPWESENNTYFELKVIPEGTMVTWGMSGKMPRPMNIFGLFMNMEEMVGGDFEKGLLKLKTSAERYTADHSRRGYLIREFTFPQRYYIGFRSKVKFPEIGKYFARYFPMISRVIQNSGLETAGPPSGLFYVYDEKAMITDMSAAIPVMEDTVFKGFVTQPVEGKAMQIAYYGPYEQSAEAYYALDDYIKDNSLGTVSMVMEEYITDPAVEKDTSKWLTNIYYFIKED